MTQDNSDAYLFTDNLITSNLYEYEQFAYLIIIIDTDWITVKEQVPNVSFISTTIQNINCQRCKISKVNSEKLKPERQWMECVIQCV